MGRPTFTLRTASRGMAAGASPNAPAAAMALDKPPALRDHTLYKTMVARGAYFKPEMPETDMQYPAYYDPNGTNPKWDPTQKTHHEWHELVKGEMDNTVANAGIVQDVYSKISITGPKSKEFLSKILTCAVPGKVGNAKLGYVCRADGQLMNECTIANRGENDYYYCGQLGWGQYEMDLLLPLRESLGYSADEVVINNYSHHYELLHVPGPKAKQIVTEVMGADAADLDLFKFKKLTIDGIEMEIFRMSFTGMPGWEFHVPAEHAGTVWDKICDHPFSVESGLKPYGLLAVAGLRIEQHYRVSADVKNVSHYSEMSIDRFVSPKKREKSGFHGCDNSVVPKKELCYLAVDTLPGYEWTLTFSPGSPVFLNGQQVGATTSSAWAGRSKTTHAVAMLDQRDLGDGLSIKVEGQEFPARVLREPLVPWTGDDC